MFTESQPQNELEQKSISQFDAWTRNWGLKRNWQFFFSSKAILDTIELKNGMSILDVGCASGILLHQISQKMKDVKLNGLDISPQMVILAKERLGESIKIKEGSAHKLPYDDSSFDLVTCATSFHHYPDSQRALSEMFRVLKPGGKVVLLDVFIDGIMRKIACRMLNILFQEKDTHLFTKDEMKNMFRQAGFTRIRQQHYLLYKLITTGEKKV